MGPSTFSVRCSQHAPISAVCHPWGPGDGGDKIMARRDSSASWVLVHSSDCQGPLARLPMPRGRTASAEAMRSLEDRCSRPKILCFRLEDSTSPAASVPHSAAWGSQQDPTPVTPQCLIPQPGVKMFPRPATWDCLQGPWDGRGKGGHLNKGAATLLGGAGSGTGTQNPILSPRRAV